MFLAAGLTPKIREDTALKLTRFHEGRHLSEADIYSVEAECPICGFRAVREQKALIQREPTIGLLYCPACRGCSASHMPKPEYLNKYYDAYYEPSISQKIATDGPSRLARRIVSWAATSPSRPFRIMDFGGGDGTVAVLAAESMARFHPGLIQIQVVDYVKGEPSKHAAIEIEYVPELGLSEGNCDLIIACSVTEHIPHLGQLLRDLVGKIRPGGVLYVRTPYIRPLLKAGIDFTYPAHVHDLGDEFWGRLPDSLTLPLAVTHSRPSICETTLRTAFARTLVANVLKIPAQLECYWTRHPMFKLYGGWEAAFVRTV
jgi:SAM-dependent methyltransferase